MASGTHFSGYPLIEIKRNFFSNFRSANRPPGFRVRLQVEHEQLIGNGLASGHRWCEPQTSSPCSVIGRRTPFSKRVTGKLDVSFVYPARVHDVPIARHCRAGGVPPEIGSHTSTKNSVADWQIRVFAREKSPTQGPHRKPNTGPPSFLCGFPRLAKALPLHELKR